MAGYRADWALCREVLTSPQHTLAFGLGTGLLPVAPGTWASASTALLFWLASPVPLYVQLIGAALLFIVGVRVCGESSRRLGVHDHQGIVLDEVVGMLLTLTVARLEPLWIGVGFLAFRAADVWKPWPIRDMDHRLSGGLGIMLDDVLAAVYAAAALFLLQQMVAGL
jgi:phosphatidylglycerophosphatase A